MKVAICLIVKNEAADIAEWIAYYRALGADALLIFDNDSSDETVQIVAAAATLSDIRLFRWSRTDRRSQMDVYEYACLRWRDDFDWIGCFDSDEYLVLHGGRGLADLLDRPATCGAVAMNWAVFGSNGHQQPPAEPLIAAFTRRSPASFFPNRHVKAFVRPAAVRSCSNPHYFHIDGHYEDPAGNDVAWYYVAAGNYEERGVTAAAADYEVCQLNHYFVRSRAHWLRKLGRGYPTGILGRTEDEFATYDLNDVEDRSACALLPAVKAHTAAIRKALQDGPHPPPPRANHGPVVHVLAQGNMANRMIQHMVASRIASMVPGCLISNVELPEWSIHHPSLPAKVGQEIMVEGQRVDVEHIAERLRTGQVSRVLLPAYGQHLSNFPDRETCRSMFPADPAYPGYGADRLVCNIRGGEVLDARHPHYTLLPAAYYAELAMRTGLAPVFTGQIEDNVYCHELRRMFPDAEFRPSEGAYADFQRLRNSQHLVLAVSTFSWLAAWLSDASRIFLPLSGLFHPVQCPDIDLIPLDDGRYSFMLFPINFAVPVAEFRTAHAGLAGSWREVRAEAVAALRTGPRWPRRVDRALPLLEEPYYLAHNPDVAAEVARGSLTALEHYYKWGHSEGRRAFPFDAEWYSRTYPMAAFEVGQADYADLEHHYVEIGRARGYRPVPTRLA